MLRTSVEPAGTQCAAGGSKLESGQDTDANGQLDLAEINAVQYVCKGVEGSDGGNGMAAKNGIQAGLVALQVSSEPAGDNCPNAGQRIDIATDADADGVADPDALASTIYVCNGVDAEVGLSGRGTRLVVTQELPGTNCVNGGKRVDYGTDSNRSGSLDSVERIGTSYLCDGASGSVGVTGLVNVSQEDAGLECAAGGSRIESGTDLDADGVLDAGEVTEAELVCHGVDGDDAVMSLVSVSEEGFGTNCAAGGQRVRMGLDSNANQALDPSEILQTEYACHGVEGSDGADGASGRTTLVVVTEEFRGAACAAGGRRIQSGQDADRSGTLAVNEITQTEYVCNGVDGADGSEGAPPTNALVSVNSEPPGANCASGGQRIESGPDADRDATLDAEEIVRTDYVCHGTDGFDGAAATNGRAVLVTVGLETAGTNCASGGQRVVQGLDDDRDQVLDAGEVDATRYVCNGSTGTPGTSGSNGLNGRQALAEVVPEPLGLNCVQGGQRLTYGRDDDRDSVLDAGEIAGTRYVCNGVPGTGDGADANDALHSLVSVTAEPPGPNCNGGGQRVDVGFDDDGDIVLDAGEIDGTSYVCDFDEFVNPSFELADYLGWTVASTASGQWMLGTAGTTLNQGDSVFDYADQQMETLTSPGLAYTVVATNGSVAAVHTQSNPGVHRIYQEFTISATATTLRWDMYYRNTAGVFDPTSQYVAVNIRSAATDAVIATIFKTEPGDTLVLAGMLPFSADLTPYAGQTVRLDFETNIQFSWLDLSLDNFRIE